MVVIGILLSVVFIVVILGVNGLLPFARHDPLSHVTESLRDLLHAKKEGRISEDEYNQKQTELHLLLLEDPRQIRRRYLYWIVPALVIGAITGSFSFLDRVKEAPQSVDVITSSKINIPAFPSKSSSQPISPVSSQTNSGGDLNTMVKRLAAKMEKDPKNGDGWLLLARTYNELRQPKEAANAYAKAAELLPADASMLADWVDARVLSNDRKWDPESREIVARALKTDAKHLKVLALAGSEAFDRSDYKSAISYWKQILVVAPSGSKDANLADMNIKEALTLERKK